MREKEHLRAEEKAGIIEDYLNGAVGWTESVKRAGCGDGRFQQWVRKYESEGIEGFLPQKKNRVYSPEQKRQAVQSYLAGEGSLVEVSEKYGLRDESRLREWIKVYMEILTPENNQEEEAA